MPPRKKRFLSDQHTIVEPNKLEGVLDSMDVQGYPAYNVVLNTFKNRNVDTVYCLGLGDPCKNLAARYQFSFIKKICNELAITSIFCYDPETCIECQKVLNEIGFTTVEDTKGCFEFGTKKAFYYPHCPVFLYHNLLTTNMSPEKMENLLLIGNSIEQYYESIKYTPPKTKTILEELHLKGIISEKSLDFNNNYYFHTITLMEGNTPAFPPASDPFWQSMPILDHFIE